MIDRETLALIGIFVMGFLGGLICGFRICAHRNAVARWKESQGPAEGPKM